MKRAIWIPIIVAWALVVFGCGPPVVKHPDASMLITDSRMNAVRVSVWQKSHKRLIDYGWVSTGDLVGWTVSKFDWDSVIEGD